MLLNLLTHSTQLFAQAAPAAGGGPSVIEQMIPFIGIFAIFYFLIIRPQSKRQKDHAAFVTNLKRGDSVITASGIFGKVEGISDKFVTLEVSEGVNIRILKTQVASTVNEGAANA
jgi:preprotein translocase subunit YajC